MKASEAIKKILPFPGIDSEPTLSRTSSYVETVKDSKGQVKACVYKTVYHVEIHGFFEHKNKESWVTITTGFRDTPAAAMREWNRLVTRIRKEVSDGD